MKLVVIESPYRPAVPTGDDLECCYRNTAHPPKNEGDLCMGVPCPSCHAWRAWFRELQRNIAYGRAALKDCLSRGEAPFASHLLYTQPNVLDDAKPEQRRAGIEAGFAWRELTHATVVYQDLGISPGMQLGIDHANKHGHPVERRSLLGWRGGSGGEKG